MIELLVALFSLLVAPLGYASVMYVEPAAGGGPTVLSRMDFEGGVACQDSGAGPNCTTNGGPPLCDVDCVAAEGNCPLAGVRSARCVALAGVLYDGGLASATSKTLDFAVQVTDTTTSFGFAGGHLSNTDAFFCGLQYRGVPSEMRIRCASGVTSTAFAISSATTYWIRMEYNPQTDLCTFWIDTLKANIGNGIVGAASCDGTNTGVLDGWDFVAQDANMTTTIDDIGYCDGAVTAGTKCGP